MVRIAFVFALTGIAMTAFANDLVVKNEAEFAKIIAPDAKVEKLAGDFRFVEGPAWTDADGGYLLFSDIPANRICKWTKSAGVTTWREDSHNANGNTRDREGRLVTCEHGSRTVTRTELDGTVVTLADKHDGRPLNSPNDVVIKSDGSIWFTDPPYGIDAKKKEQKGNYVYRLDPRTRDLRPVITDMEMPNGLCFSPGEAKLYVADSGKPHHVRVFDVKADGTLGGGAVFCVIDPGVPDGIRCDADGRLWSSAADGVHIFMPDGTLIGKILTPAKSAAAPQDRESVANLCFGGEDGRTLFLTARTSLYAIKVKVTGATANVSRTTSGK